MSESHMPPPPARCASLPSTPRSAPTYSMPEWGFAPPDNMEMRFDVLRGGVQIDSVPIRLVGTSYVVVGRAADMSDIACSHPSVSRCHAAFQFGAKDSSEVASLYIYDLKSTHGTKVNKRVVAPLNYEALRDGDHIVFGDSTRSYILAIDHSAGELSRDVITGDKLPDEAAVPGDVDGPTCYEHAGKVSKRAAEKMLRKEERRLKLIATQEKRDGMLAEIQSIEAKQHVQELSENQKRQIEALVRKVEAFDEKIANESDAIDEKSNCIDSESGHHAERADSEGDATEDVADATLGATPFGPELYPLSRKESFANLLSLHKELCAKVDLAQKELNHVQNTIRKQEAQGGPEEDALDNYMAANWRLLLESERRNTQKQLNDARLRCDHVHKRLCMQKETEVCEEPTFHKRPTTSFNKRASVQPKKARKS